MPLETSSPAQAVGSYDLVEKIAEGGMATVFKARHQETGALAAVKIVPAHLAKNPVLLKRFEQEYTVAKTLDHENIIRALEFGQTGGCPYLVMEYVDGESLGDLLERAGRLELSEALRIGISVLNALLNALDYSHENIVHRDIKPSNILLDKHGFPYLGAVNSGLMPSQ